jgi:hypothetical protein
METPLQARPGQPASVVRSRNRPPFGVELWVLVSAVVTAAGWLLSAIHQLNGPGYAIVLTGLALAVVWWEKGRGSPACDVTRLRRVVRRMRRPLPCGFLVLFSLALAAAVLHPPTNYDALAYRVPRVLHWLADGQWHWVHTAFPRLNIRACGQEWLIAPIIALTGGSHWTVVPSLVSYLLLPGLFYSVFIRFGIKPRSAWHWMWICASGYCYVTQAGGLGNDLPGAVFALAAFDFALRLRQSGHREDLRFFMLAAGLMTGAKASNILLLLPLFLIVLPRWRSLLVKRAANCAFILLAALASFLPTAILNLRNCGDWTGMHFEGPMKPMVTQFGINSVNTFLLTVAPPVFPWAARWTHFLSSTAGLSPDVVRSWGVPDLADEGGIGLGLGICLLLVLSLVASSVVRRRARSKNQSLALPPSWKLILWSPYISLFVFCLKAQAVASVTRLLTPYWAVLLVPLLLFGFDESLVRLRWWKRLAVGIFVLAAVPVVLSPSRPLWPAQTILGRLHQSHPGSALITRAQTVYAVYAQRSEAFAPLVAALPPDATLLGMVTFDDPEASLWWPPGSRRIEHVTPADDLQYLQAHGIKYIIAPAECLALTWPVESVIQKYHAGVVARVPLLLRVEAGVVDWYILKVPAPQ